MSKVKDESISFLKRQLEFLHTQMISMCTQNLVRSLKLNPSYDVISDIYERSMLLKNLCESTRSDPSVFMNAYMPMRVHPTTRTIIDIIARTHKPANESIYYGLIFAERAVVAVMKNNPKIIVMPAGNLFIKLSIIEISI